jgi:hypothetical protein
LRIAAEVRVKARRSRSLNMAAGSLVLLIIAVTVVLTIIVLAQIVLYVRELM